MIHGGVADPRKSHLPHFVAEATQTTNTSQRKAWKDSSLKKGRERKNKTRNVGPHPDRSHWQLPHQDRSIFEGTRPATTADSHLDCPSLLPRPPPNLHRPRPSPPLPSPPPPFLRKIAAHQITASDLKHVHEHVSHQHANEVCP